MGVVSTPEPFKKLRHQGTVLAYSYEDAMGRYHELGEVELRGEDVFLKTTGEKLKVTVEKMSKAKMNGISPDDVVRDYGADVLRLYEMFMGEFELPKPWDPRAIEGVNRFVKRVWRLVEEWDAAKAPADDPHLRLRHKTIKRVTHDLERMQFNTSIAALMEYLNVLAEGGVNRATRADLDAMIGLVAPFAPHLADEAWAHLGGQDRKPAFMLEQAWPAFDDKLTIDDTVSIGVQVDGKVRGSVDLSPTAAEEQARAAALAVANVAKHLEGRVIRKFIYKPGRIIGIVSAPA
jgi:leucyl-tRNA synthetase